MNTRPALSPTAAGDTPGASDLFGPLAVGEDAALARLRVRLLHEADGSGVLDIAYRTVDTPVGSLLLAASERGLLRVVYECQGHDAALADLAAKVSPRILYAAGRLDTVAGQLEEYFTGRRRGFDLSLDWRLVSGFRLRVLEHLPQIGYGHTESYRDVAAAAGSPRAVRAAGTACATNPLPVVVPCHRVVRADGTPGGYAGGPAAKQALLALEQ